MAGLLLVVAYKGYGYADASQEILGNPENWSLLARAEFHNFQRGLATDFAENTGQGVEDAAAEENGRQGHGIWITEFPGGYQNMDYFHYLRNDARAHVWQMEYGYSETHSFTSRYW